jgi:dipeptidyl aminopeptidase/acylaminoacyl peptidase
VAGTLEEAPPMTRNLTSDDLYALKLAEDPRLSPDGQRVAYVVMSIDRPTYEYRRAVWVAPAAGGEARAFTSGPNDSSPRWSPDGRQIAFVRARAAKSEPKTQAERDHGVGKPQIWVLPADGGEARQVTIAREGAHDPVWSPDGATLLFTTETGAPDDPEAVDAKVDGKDIPTVRTIDRLWYRLDGQGWNYERRVHLFSISVGGGEPRQLTEGDWDDGSASWSPDGRRVAFTSDRSQDRWRWPAGDIWVMDVASGALQRLTDESLHCGAPAWSPDGLSLAFAASPRRHPDGHVDFYVMPANGSASARRLTDDFIPTCSDTCIDDQRAGHGPARPSWSTDGAQIYFLAAYRGATQVYAVSPAGGAPREVTRGDRHVYAATPDAACRTLALGISDPVTPGDVFVLTLDRVDEAHRLTDLNATLRGEAALAAPRAITFTGADGWELQGWILRPSGIPAERATPAILEIHGGPRAMYGWSFFFEFQLLAAHGYTVVYTNPRGSTGYGRTFSSAVAKDWGGKDFEDLIAGLDAAIAEGGIDPDRLGVAGGSYGGYMTNWAIGHTDRFKAAVTMRCVSNLATMFGTSDVGWDLLDEYFDVMPWENLDKLMQHSPITYVANMRTPLLILHSENDLRCSIGEAEQLYAALKYLGREVKMVRFAGQSHDLSRNGHPRSRVLRLRHIVDWLSDHIPVASSAAE